MVRLKFFVTVFCVCFSLFSYGQSGGTTSADSVSVLKTQYVKIEVGMHILDCPVLPKQLKAKLMTVKGIKDYREDTFTQAIYFNVPEGAITREQIIGVAKGCAFPEQAINVKMDSSPFPN